VRTRSEINDHLKKKIDSRIDSIHNSAQKNEKEK
jgi:hypothetical protein